MITKETFKKIMSKNIKNERIASNLSVDELANIMGMTSGFMGLIERGKRGVTAFNLYKLASVFDIDIQRLITENNDYEQSDENMRDKKFKKLTSLSSQLDEKRLDFLIETIKNLRTGAVEPGNGNANPAKQHGSLWLYHFRLFI